jgi:hypothetical protein
LRETHEHFNDHIISLFTDADAEADDERGENDSAAKIAVVVQPCAV